MDRNNECKERNFARLPAIGRRAWRRAAVELLAQKFLRHPTDRAPCGQSDALLSLPPVITEVYWTVASPVGPQKFFAPLHPPCAAQMRPMRAQGIVSQGVASLRDATIARFQSVPFPNAPCAPHHF